MDIVGHFVARFNKRVVFLIGKAVLFIKEKRYKQWSPGLSGDLIVPMATLDY